MKTKAEEEKESRIRWELEEITKKINDCNNIIEASWFYGDEKVNKAKETLEYYLKERQRLVNLLNIIS